jgi:hypothetical protein
VVLVLGLALLPTGCAWKGDASPGGADAADRVAWQIKPVAMRIYPSTRFAREGASTALEARIEFVDDAGDPLKAAGDLRLELFPAGRPGEPAAGKPLYTWDASILTRQENQDHYDPATRTYLLRLKLDDPGLTRQPLRLRVMFIPQSPDRLQADTVLEAGRPGDAAPSPAPASAPHTAPPR